MTIQDRINRSESFIVASDGQYLGQLILNQFAPESILNPYGVFGSPYGANSIYNQYSMYGSPYSSLSPHNPYTTTPPIIYLRGQNVGYLTTNPYMYGAVNPGVIVDWMRFNSLY